MQKVKKGVKNQAHRVYSDSSEKNFKKNIEKIVGKNLGKILEKILGKFSKKPQYFIS